MTSKTSPVNPRRTLEDWLTHIQSVHWRTIDMSLERVRRVLDNLHIQPLEFVLVSVAGTNGKGSSVGMLEAILAEDGYRTGAYTSPHLVHYGERIRVQGTPAAEAELCRAFEMIEAARDDVPLTYFEFGTLAALLIFHNHNVDVALLEVGMGGRLDAVNAVDADVSLITSIAIDHVNWLGPDRARIAVEKAGVMRAGRPAVVADAEPPPALIEYAQRLKAHLYLLRREFDYQVRGDVWDWSGPGHRRHRALPKPGLMGQWQFRNAAGALMVLECLATQLSVSSEAIRRGLRSVNVPGRFQVLPGGPEIILDVAHNVAAVSALRDQLRTLGARRRTLAVCAMLRDKPVREVAKLLSDDIDQWWVAPIDDPRGAGGEELYREVFHGLGPGAGDKVASCVSVTEAFERARAAAHGDDRILVFGSFHTVGDIIAHLNLPSV